MTSPPTSWPSNVADFEAAARAALPASVWTYLSRGAGDGVTLQANRAAWRRLSLRPRILRSVAEVTTGVTVLGRPIAAPILAAPTGRATRYHPDGESAVLRAVHAGGVAAVLASSVSWSLELLMREAPGALSWSQLYISPDRDRTAEALARAEAAGCAAVVLTVDLVPGGSPAPADLPPLHRPAWEAPDDPDPAPLFAAAGLDDLAWVCARTALPVVVKGVLRGDDAEACVEAGAAGLVVSNHGGNQVDTVIPTVDALAEVVTAIAGRAEVYVDGGVRGGVDVLKALALGARAVLVGRPIAWGLAAGGADGAEAIIACLRSELERAMRHCGVREIGEIGGDLLG